MHLLVLSAFRLDIARRGREVQSGLNAPSGAQCFPTEHRHGLRGPLKQRSQCTFWCSVLSDSKTKMVPSPKRGVSMHLLVFSAFRLIADVSEVKEYKSQCIFWCSVLSDRNDGSVRGGFHGFQCTFWCSVLSDVKPANEFGTAVAFQCTFWCSVLSDPTERKWNSGKVNFVSMHLLVLSAFRPSTR